MTDDAPPMAIRDTPRRLTERVSVVWLVPVAALAVALVVAWRNYTDQGPLIEIAFENATGIAPGETELRYRDVSVGIVEEVGFSEGLGQVLVSVRLDAGIADYVDGEAAFWLVQPEVTTRGVSGLGTVLSGVYIEGVWDERPGGLAQQFTALDRAPLLRAGEQGVIFRLRAADGAVLTEGTPILYKGIEVGQVGRPELVAGGTVAQAEAVIRAPYAGLLRTTTRFWDTSGFTFSLGTQGAELDFSSLASLISGGVTFETVVSGGETTQAGAIFTLYPDPATARSSLFTEGGGPPVNLAVVFEENISGLTAGSPVVLGGVTVGEVSNLSGIVDRERFGDERLRLLATLAIRPSRLGIDGGEAATLEFLAAQIESGLRAQLQSASLLTGGLKVELDLFPDAVPASLDRDAEPFPRIPTVPAEISDVAATAEGVFERINALPVEDLIQSAIDFLDSATALVADGALQRVPEEVTGLLGDVRGLVASDQIQALPSEVGALVEDLRAASQDLRGLTADLREADAAQRLSAALVAATRAADGVAAALEGAPALVGSLAETADTLRALPLEALVADLDNLILAGQELLASPDAQALPAELRGLVSEAQGVSAELGALVGRLREAGAVERLVDALESAAAAAASVESGTEGLPSLVNRLNEVAAQAAEVPLNELASEVSQVLETVRTFLADGDTRAVPAAVSGALGEVEAALSELRAGGTVDNANRAIASAGAAAAAIEDAAAELPALVSRIDALLRQADGTLSGYGAGSELNRDARAALREVERAAAAVESLARALERRPNSLILGR